VVTLVILLILGLVAFLLLNIFSGDDVENGIDTDFINMEQVDFFAYHSHFNPNQIVVAIDGEYVQPHPAPQFIDGELYLPASFLRTYVDRYIFWEPDNSRLTISTWQEISRFTPNSNTYTVNWQEHYISTPIRQVGDMAFMPVQMVMERYPVAFEYHEHTGVLTVSFTASQQVIYRVEIEIEENEDGYENNPEIPMRFGAGLNHPILTFLHLGEQVEILYEDGEFYFIQTVDGLMGYAPSDYLIFDDFIAGVAQVEERRPITRPPFGGAINMLWHLVGNHTAAANVDSFYAPRGVNVISPTWLYFDEGLRDGTLVSMANNAYMQWARQNGMQVWPMLSDAFFGGNFSNEVSRLVLMDAEIRDRVISGLMAQIHQFGFDGINVDYEAVRAPEADHFIQFLRELSVPMREAGKVLSVATFVPIPDNMFWNRYEIGHAVDFLTIMAYDEHWETAPTAGPVASFDWVNNAVIDTMREVPAEQIVVGLPTYVRIWTEEFNMETAEWQLLPWGGDNAPEQRHRAVGFAFGRQLLQERGATFHWDYLLRQYTTTHHFTHNNTEMRISVWLEEERSIREKLSVFTQNNIAGVAWWRKGLEPAVMWDWVADVLQ